MTMIGWAMGGILFGALLDIYGRRRIILLGLLIFSITSFLAVNCRFIEELMLIRFIQGLSVSVISVGSRALIADNFSGHRFNIGLIYASLAFGLGPIVGPFVGGLLQYHFGWKADFWLFGLLSFFLIMIFMLFINESIAKRHPFSLKNALGNYAHVLHSHIFLAGILIMAASQIELLTYPAIGSFFMENILHRTSIAYGNSALVISIGYLLGTLSNRLLIKRLHVHHITDVGFGLLILSAIVQISFALLGVLNLFTLILPIMLIGFSNGFIFPNMIGRCMKLFPDIIGVATAVMVSFLMFLSAVGIFLISHVKVNGLSELTFIFVVTIVIQLLIFYRVFKRATRNYP